MAEWARRYARMSDSDCPVRPSSLPMHSSDSEACLPLEVEQLLLDVVADGFVVYCCGPKAAPTALVAVYQWQDYVDLITIRHFERVTTARIPAPAHSQVDVFNPEVVVWAYEGPPHWALRALLNLIPPQHPNAATSTYPAPPSLRIPRAEQRPMTIRVPPPGQAGMRTARLTATTAPAG